MILSAEIRQKNSKNALYPELTVDGVSLEALISERSKEPDVRLLVPAHAWLYKKAELELAWDRILMCRDGDICNVPILVCDTDMDFSCLVVVAEQQCCGNIIIWSKFGFALDAQLCEVSWLHADNSMNFPRSKFIDEIFKYAELCEWSLEY